MILIGLKDICHIGKDEIIERAKGFSPFYEEYILSPISAKDGKPQVEHSAHRLAMVEMLHGFCKHKFAKMPNLVFGDKGKPYFCDEKDVHFSFSHSKNLAVCAISLPSVDEHALGTAIDFCDIGEEDDEGAQCVHSECVYVLHDEATECIGVDIQVSADSAPLSYNHEKIAGRFFSGEQIERLNATPTEEKFTELWCELESLSKMTGEGIAAYNKKGKENAKIKTIKVIDTHKKEFYLSIAYR